MRAYKAFNAKLQATKGHGVFQFEPGKTYREGKAKCANRGFHCAENPLTVFDYYNSDTDRYFIVEAEGDINQDGFNSRIACTELTLMKELTKLQIVTLGVRYIQEHPMIKNESIVSEEEGTARNGFLVCRGKQPKGKGKIGDYLCFLKECKGSRRIKEIECIEIDGKEFEENKWYIFDSGEVKEWNSEKTSLES